ncbi:MAG: SusC/RagA family TonB-linked outer membrane protein [Bacteroidota bacterium]
MRTKLNGILTLMLAFVVQLTFAQEKTVTGTVTDENGLPMPGADVLVKGTNQGTQTDFDGNYSIEASADDILVFKFLGFSEQEIQVGNQSTINVELQEDSADLDEVIVEAYRTSSKKKSNVAQSTVTSETIKARPNANFMQTLQSQVPGLNISTGSGQPGASSQVLLRGVGSINGNTQPLYVIDGVPQDGQNFRSLNPNEIENVSVLKDAGATAIYGNRGANGVIVVTTKRGNYEQALKIEYNGTMGFNDMQEHSYNTMSSRQLLSLENSRGVGRGAQLSQQEIDEYDVETDWQDVFFRQGLTQSHTVNLTSGSKNLRSFTSLGYTEQEGMLKNTGLKRFTFRNNLNGKSDDGKFEYGTSLTVNYSKRTEMNSTGTGSVNQNYVLGANAGAPYIDTDEYEGSQQLTDLYNEDGTLRYTPLMLMDKMRKFHDKSDELKAILNLDAKYQFTDELSFNTRLGFDYTHGNRNVFQSANSFNTLLFLETDQEFGGFEDNVTSRQLIANFTNELRYDKVFDEVHTVQASLFTEYIKAHSRGFSASQTGLDPRTESGFGTGYVPYDPSNDFYVPGIGANAANGGLFSYFGFVDYDYDSRFGFSGSVRRDASYRFSDTNRWGTFYSLSGRWNITEEDFMANSAFDMLKLRASHGLSGNQNIAGPSLFSDPNRQFTTYGFGASGYAGAPGLGISALGYSALRWEEIRQTNVGIDFALFKQRLRGAMDIYRKTSLDLYQSRPISAANGITSLNQNFGDMENNGIELQAAYDIVRDRQNELVITLKFNGSYNDNELTKLPTDAGNSWDGESLTANFEGGILNQFYVLEYAGVNPTNGNLLFRNNEGELTENPDPATDRYFTDKSFIPRVQGGFGLDVDYKGWFLSSQFSYVADVLRYDYDYAGLMDPNDLGTFNLSQDILDYWTPDNRITNVPALNANNRGLEEFSDRFLSDASYLRLRFLSVGYNFPKNMLGNNLDGLRIFVQGENLLTWSKWRGWDAESTRAADQYQYPTPKIYNVGIEVKF